MAIQPTLAFLNFTPIDIIIVAVVGLLLFGRRLPEVGKNLGKTIVEFKRGLSSANDEISKAVQDDPARLPPSPLPNKSDRPMKQIAGTGDEP